MPIFEVLRNEPDARELAAGQTIFLAGDAGDCMYAVLDGEVELRKGERVLETVGHGGVFGEMALIDGAPRSATAMARTDCRLVAIGQRRFLTLVQQTPFFALQLMQVLTERLRRNGES
jgi:CRP/FNR family cyclic AMP-dependent transcriptional regulator